MARGSTGFGCTLGLMLILGAAAGVAWAVLTSEHSPRG
jgi:hypothetical protein